jgi:hypothetical protein
MSHYSKESKDSGCLGALGHETFENGPQFKAVFGNLLRKEYPNIKIPKPMPFWKEHMEQFGI